MFFNIDTVNYSEIIMNCLPKIMLQQKISINPFFAAITDEEQETEILHCKMELAMTNAELPAFCDKMQEVMEISEIKSFNDWIHEAEN